MLDLLAALLVGLLILEFTKWKVIRIIVLLSIVLALIRIVADYQTQARVCRMEEDATVKLIAELGTNACQMVSRAADAYMKDKQAATYEKPFTFGFYRYLREQKDERDFQQIDSGNAGSRPRP